MSDTKVQRTEISYSCGSASSTGSQRYAAAGLFARILEGAQAAPVQQGPAQPGQATQAPVDQHKSNVPAHAVVAVAVANGMQLNPNRRLPRNSRSSSEVTSLTDVAAPSAEFAEPTKEGVVDPFASITNLAAGGHVNAQLMLAQRQMNEISQSFNIQYLMIQQTMEKDNRAFTTLSNVLKAKAEGAKQVIKNVA